VSIKAPSSSQIRVIVCNNLLSENTQFLSGLTLASEAGNQTYVSGDLNSDYSPTQNAFNKLKNLLEPDINNTLSANLKAQGISLIPAKEYVHPLGTRTLKTAPQIAGAIQTAK
jgi:hypothetical protein